LFDVQPIDKTQRLNWKQLGIDTKNFDLFRKKSLQASIQSDLEDSFNQFTINEFFEGFAILITGQALIHALSDRLNMKFLEIAPMCKALICCRVTPMQKAQVVELVIKHEKQTTLAIGDGANDVSMIQKAHIGIGISGQEGQQAVLASDFSFGQFRYLERLLLIHGRLSYLRVSKFLRYFFYKNFAFTFCHFWFSFFCGFSAQTVYDPMYGALYNSLFSTFPILFLSIFDRDVNDNYSLNKPYLYIPGQKDEFFNKKVLIKSIFHGILSSLLIFFITYLSISNGKMIEMDLQSFGFLIGTIIVIIVNLQNALQIWYWTIYYHLALWLTILIYFLFHLTLYSTYLMKFFRTNYTYVGVAKQILFDPKFYLILILICVVLLLPVFIQEFYQMRFIPDETNKARYNQKYRYEEKARFIEHIRPKKHLRKRLPRSSYAFAQQEGWGKLITSGIMQTKKKPHTRASHDLNIHQRKSRIYSTNLTGTL
ncbi:unnamed protein product, partial [Adineta ricciae]